MKPLLLLPLILLPGCASVVQTATTTSTNPTNGVVTVTEARSSILAMGNARTIVDKVRASAGKTSSVGASGVNEDVTNNIAQNINALTGLLKELSPK